MRIAFYKAKYGTLLDKIISTTTFGPYSHCELVFSNGIWFSSSPRDGGVRYIELSPAPAHWDYIEIPLSIEQEEDLLYWCDDKIGLDYDWFGVLRFAVPILPNNKDKWFCSEICIAGLQYIGLLQNLVPYRTSPNKLYSTVRLNNGLVIARYPFSDLAH